jgi:hypothetical protein
MERQNVYRSVCRRKERHNMQLVTSDRVTVGYWRVEKTVVDYGFLSCDAILSCRWLPKFRRNLLPPSAELTLLTTCKSTRWSSPESTLPGNRQSQKENVKILLFSSRWLKFIFPSDKEILQFDSMTKKPLLVILFLKNWLPVSLVFNSTYSEIRNYHTMCSNTHKFNRSVHKLL